MKNNVFIIVFAFILIPSMFFGQLTHPSFAVKGDIKNLSIYKKLINKSSTLRYEFNYDKDGRVKKISFFDSTILTDSVLFEYKDTLLKKMIIQHDNKKTTHNFSYKVKQRFEYPIYIYYPHLSLESRPDSILVTTNILTDTIVECIGNVCTDTVTGIWNNPAVSGLGIPIKLLPSIPRIHSLDFYQKNLLEESKLGHIYTDSLKRNIHESIFHDTLKQEFVYFYLDFNYPNKRYFSYHFFEDGRLNYLSKGIWSNNLKNEDERIIYRYNTNNEQISSLHYVNDTLVYQEDYVYERF